MNPGTFLKNSERIVTGKGFKRDIPISLYEAHLESDGSVLTTTLSTNPGFGKSGTNMTILTWAAGKVVEGGLSIQLPEDYDESNDHCILKLLAKSAGTDVPSIDAKVYHQDATTTDLDPTKSDALSTTLAWVEIDLSGNDFQGGDVIQVVLFPEAHNNHAVEVWAIKLQIKSDLVYYTHDNR